MFSDETVRQCGVYENQKASSFQVAVESRYVIATQGIGFKISRRFLNQWEATQKQSRFVRAIFPALWASDRQLLGILIGSSRCLLLLWLVGVIYYCGIGFESVIWKPLAT